MLDNKEFDITSPPKEGHENVGEWAWTVYELSRQWRDEELRMPDVWEANYKLFRRGGKERKKQSNNVSVNLFFANIVRTVANVTARHPVAEVVDLDGNGGDEAKVTTARVKKWWLDTGQREKMRSTVLNSEIYGITWEKAVWAGKFKEPKIVVADPYAIFPYPGYYENMATDCPAICHATAIEPKIVEKEYKTDDVQVDETYSLLGGEREEITGVSTYGSTRHTTGIEGGTVRAVNASSAGAKGEKALVVEVWCRDYSTGKDGLSKYPGGIRCIVITNNGKKVLSDDKNPNLNFAMKPEQYESNYLYSRLPFYKNNSYQDTTSIFGFSAAEQTAHLNVKIDDLISRLTNYAMRAMTGILVIPPKSGITRNMLNTKPGLTVFPDTAEAAVGIRFVPLPNPPAIIERVVDMLITMHDRVHAIQDSDRGETPSGITAASAIVALQERNAVLIQHKIDGIDNLVAERGNHFVALMQMHGHHPETVQVDDETYPFQGDTLAGKNFNYTVESGSSMPKTSLQLQEQAVKLHEVGAIDNQALLESVNFPKWKEILERTGEDQLEMAMQVLIQAGMPEEDAVNIMQLLQQPQGGPGNTEQTGEDMYTQEPQAGVPRAYQGEVVE